MVSWQLKETATIDETSVDAFLLLIQKLPSSDFFHPENRYPRVETFIVNCYLVICRCSGIIVSGSGTFFTFAKNYQVRRVSMMHIDSHRRILVSVTSASQNEHPCISSSLPFHPKHVIY